MSEAEPDIDIKPSSLEPSCEKLSEPLSGPELGIDINFSSLEKPSEELIEEQSLSRAKLDIDINSSFIKNICEELLKDFCLGLSYILTQNHLVMSCSNLNRSKY